MRLRQLKEPLLLYLRGLAIGVADLVPGISGGTIAFITGIYPRLLNALQGIDLFSLSLLLRGEWKTLWRRVDAAFLGLLLAGILSSIFSFAHALGFLQLQYPVFLRAFFMGLVAASAWHMLRRLGRFRRGGWLWLGLGIALAYGMARMTVWTLPSSLGILFLGGVLSISAAVLPGVSGSFILLLLGQYAYIIKAVRHADFLTLSVFAMGCIVGLLLFSRLIKRLLDRHEQPTISLLTGLMIGALYKLWPWQYSGQYSGQYSEQYDPPDSPQLQHVSPSEYVLLTGDQTHLFQALAGLCIGAALVLLLSQRPGKYRQGKDA